MPCAKCGMPTRGTRLCKTHRRMARAEAEKEGQRGDADEKLYQCTQCGTRYETDGRDPCPDCNSTRRRYAGPLATGGGE